MTRSVHESILWALLALTLSGCQSEPSDPAPKPPQAKPNVLLVTLDTVRPDALGWVSQKNLTPNIDRLAAAGFRFPSGVSPVPLTLPTHTSLLTAQWPQRHGVHDNGQVVPGDAVTLARQFKAQGYRTGAVISGFPLRRTFGLDLGFDSYADELPEGQEGWLERRAEATTALAIEFIESSSAGTEPWFLWVHYYDAHDPYTPPAAFADPDPDAGPEGAYRAEVRYLDHSLAPLFAMGATDNTVTVVTSDHGESFGEHGEYGHGHFIYDSTTLVPIVFHAPGRIEPGQSLAAARLIDIGPTLLDLLGLQPLPVADGVSLKPLIQGQSFEVPPAWVETRQPWLGYGWAPLAAWRRSEQKLIIAPRPELYDLGKDPGETRNLAAEQVAMADDLELEWLALKESIPVRAAETITDTEALAKLRSLGYVGSGSADAEVPANAADPKDRLKELALLNQAESALRAGEFEPALAAYAEVLKTEPDNRMAVVRSGVTYLKQNRFAEAIVFLERAVVLDPRQPETRFALADALSRSGHVKAAIPQWMETTRLQPRRVAAWSNLGTLLAQDGRMEDSREALATALSLEPANTQLMVNLAYIERSLRNTPAAIELMTQAASAEGPAFGHASTLGLMLLGERQADRARSWLSAATPGQPDFAQAKFQLALIEVYAGQVEAGRAALALAVAADPALTAQARANPMLVSLLPTL